MTPRERDILIRTILGEAADQGDQGWAAVAHVIRNRAQDPRWPDSPRDVALQPMQFSAWNDTSMGGNHLVRKYGPGDPMYERIGQVVDQAMAGDIPDPTGGATHYYAPAGMPGGREPRWFQNVTKERGDDPVRIGGHIFTGRVKGGRQYVPKPTIKSPTHPDVQHGLTQPPPTVPTHPDFLHGLAQPEPQPFIPLPERKPEPPERPQSMMEGMGGLLQSLGGQGAGVDQAAQVLAMERDLEEAAKRRRRWHKSHTWL
jgi:hypothetical protein